MEKSVSNFESRGGVTFPLLIAAALLSSAFLAGCNTVSGAGEDLSAAGNAIDRTATDAKNK